jgi:hypothetical protein
VTLPLRRRLPSIPSASARAGLFGNFDGTTQRSDCLGVSIVGVRSLPSRRDQHWTAPLVWIAPWPMHPGSPDSRSRCFPTCSGLRPRRVLPSLAKARWLLLPSMRWDHVGTRKLHAYFGAQYWACKSPVNASRAPLLSLMHDSGPGWLAGPSLLGTCTPSIVPVFIGAPQRFGIQLPRARWKKL